MVEIAEWRALKTIVRKHVDVTKEGVEVPLNQIAELGPWLEKEKLDTGTIGFRMGERFHKAVASFLGFGDIIVAEEVEQNAVTESEMLRFHVNQMEKCII